jgi:hypothetical protein
MIAEQGLKNTLPAVHYMQYSTPYMMAALPILHGIAPVAATTRQNSHRKNVMFNTRWPF